MDGTNVATYIVVIEDVVKDVDESINENVNAFKTVNDVTIQGKAGINNFVSEVSEVQGAKEVQGTVQGEVRVNVEDVNDNIAGECTNVITVSDSPDDVNIACSQSKILYKTKGC